MRLLEIEENYDIQNIVDEIENNCQPWIKEVNPTENIPFRGLFMEDVLFKKLKGHKKRKPRDSSPEKHKFVNWIIGLTDKKANRSNSIFLTNDYQQALEYGTPYFCFPAGNFHYTWSPYLKDWVSFQRRFSKENIITIKEKDFNKALIELSKYTDNVNIQKNAVNLYGDLVDYDKMQKDNFKTALFLSNLLRYLERKAWKYFTIDKEKLNEYIKGDDGTLKQAVESGNEIMVNCEHYYIVDSILKKDLIQEFKNRGY